MSVQITIPLRFNNVIIIVIIKNIRISATNTNGIVVVTISNVKMKVDLLQPLVGNGIY